MTFEIECDASVNFNFSVEAVARSLVEASLDYVKCPYECELSLRVTDNEQIHMANREFRGIDSPTDVLSFPLIEYEEPGDFTIVDDDRESYFNLETNELMLGDIIISAEKVKEQAYEYGHSERREFGFLIVHSMLHLFGYDHMEDGQRKRMESLQEDILSHAGIFRTED